MTIKQYVTKLPLVLGMGLSAILGVNTAIADEAAIDAAIKQGLERIIPQGTTVDRITPSPIPGLYEVTAGLHIYYVSADGHYLLQGDLRNLHTDEDITESKLNGARKAILDQYPESKMIIFAPEHPVHTITVFTDLDCGYCRMLHKNIADFMKEGIRVRYLSFPRSGLNSPSYYKAVSVWCSQDRQQALTDAKAGKSIPELTCDNPVADEFHLGEQMGVTGTPTIVLDDGRILPGYVPAAHMTEILNNPK